MGQDFVQLRNGSALTGEVENETFTLRLDASDTTVEMKNEKIISIVFADPGFGDTRDRVTLVNGDALFGKVCDDEIRLDSDGAGSMTIPTKDVLAVQLTFSFF